MSSSKPPNDVVVGPVDTRNDPVRPVVEAIQLERCEFG